MYLDQDPAHPEASTLYVLGRTYGKPHKYFLRTYANGTWSGWEALTLDIDGNHIVLAVWRGRLNIFWVTFVAKPLAPDAQSTTGDTTKVSDMTFDSLKTSIYSAAPLPQVQVQLSWSERIQGKWSNRISTDIDHYAPIRGIGLDFDLNREVFVHVSKELDASGNEGAVLIHLDIDDGEHGYAFRVTSKNCAPDFDPLYWEAAPSMPYEASGVDATLHVGAVTLAATFDSHVMADGSGTPTTETILGSAGAFELLTCANPVAPSPFLNPADPLFWEAGGLVSPFFYSDRSATRFANRPWSFDELTFFVQPSLTEQTMSQWEGWAVSPPA